MLEGGPLDLRECRSCLETATLSRCCHDVVRAHLE
jgi:hypothetical protein